jgi:hypothetical protein
MDPKDQQMENSTVHYVARCMYCGRPITASNQTKNGSICDDPKSFSRAHRPDTD